MSEAVTGGVAAAGVATVGACALLVIAAAAGVAYLIARGLTWLSEQAQKDLEQLEKELPPMPTQVTTQEAREAFKQTLHVVQARAAKLPALKPHSNTIATLLAFQKSPLGAFVSQSEWKTLAQPHHSQRSVSQVFKKASRSFTQATARTVSEAIADVATQEGFTHQRRLVERQGGKVMVLGDPDGRALIAEVREADEGAKVTLDLTGFADGTCHGRMEQILKGLAVKGVCLKGAVRRSHYRREGVLADTIPQFQGSAKEVEPLVSAKSRSDANRQLKRIHYWTNQVHLKARRAQ